MGAHKDLCKDAVWILMFSCPVLLIPLWAPIQTMGTVPDPEM